MRALVWITEESWEATIAAASELVPADAEVTLLHVAGGDAEAVAEGARSGLLGRGRSPERPAHPMRAVSDSAAQALLAEAAALFGRSTEQVALRGRPEHEVVGAAGRADLLVLARDGERGRPGPHSIGRHVRFVLDHVTCRVLLV
ncbi:MAG: hypothetical protein QOE87_1343 [Gaiellales bacterium]|nr:hypothetical protein [Gaiellales bacterium]